MTLKWWRRFKALLAQKLSGLGYDFSSWFRPKNIFAGQTANTLATQETIFSAVSRLGNAMGALPLSLKRAYTPVWTAEADLVANSPNPNMTSFDFFRTLEVHRDTNGNGYALKQYDDDFRVEALWILHPDRVEPVIEAKTKELWYKVEGEKGTYFVHNMDMIHVKHIHTDGYRGVSPLAVLKNTLNFDGQVRQFSLDTMDGAIKASFILKLATQLGKEKKSEVLQNFKQFYQENGGVLIQEAGTTIDPIKREFMDTRIFEVERITRTRVATVYNMPVYMLGVTEGVNYESMEQLNLDFTQGTMIPIVRQYEQELNRKMLTPGQRRQGLGFRFNLGALLRGDMKTRGEYFFKGIRTGWLTPNEARAEDDRPPLPGGEKLYMSKDLMPIGSGTEGRKAGE